VNGGKQNIHLDLLVRPRYAPDAFHLVLRASVVFPEMAKVASAMLGAHAAGFGQNGTVHVAVLDQITSNPPMILFRTEEELVSRAPEIRGHLLDRIVPYLDDRESIEALTTSMWRSWSQNAWKSDLAGRWPVIIAAGHLANGDRTSALKTLETCYPEGSGERAQYRDAFAVAAMR
jgi:hypothetical protein